MIFRSLLLLGVSVAALHAGANSGASTLLAGETQGLALDFTDDHFYASTGHYGSARVLDAGTPANDYDSHPYGLLTYTSPSLKMTMGPNGTLRFGAHNLYLNSASPANQSITVVSGMTYAVTITGTVSVAASGAATGTWTAGTQTFTAATGTLTFGSTSGAGTVHVRRTPSDSTYLATAAAARYALPYEWDSSGNLLGILVEEARTNLCLYGNDLTQAAQWVKANTTAAKTATGPDGMANSASTVTASAANGAIWQRVTSASAARITSLYIKRRTGSGGVFLAKQTATATQITGFDGTFATATGWTTGAGVTITGGVASFSASSTGDALYTGGILTVGKPYIVSFTVSNYSAGSIQLRCGNQGATPHRSANGTYTTAAVCQGATYITFFATGFTGDIDNVTVYEADETTLTVTSEWTRVSEASHTSTDPLISLRLATSGDAVDVALVQHEVGAFITSPIPTLGSTVTRAVDNISLATSAFPWSATDATLFVELTNPQGASANGDGVLLHGGSNAHMFGFTQNGGLYAFIRTASSDQTAMSASAVLTSNTTPTKVALAASANDVAWVSNGGAAVTDASATMPTVTTLSIFKGTPNYTGVDDTYRIRKIMVLPSRMSNADMQTRTT